MRRALLFFSLAGCELLFQPHLREDTDASSGDGGTPSEAGPGDGQAPTRSCPTPLKCNGDDSCCASDYVRGGTFNRSNDANAPATVSPFDLDRYEVTVGRFKAFVAVYDQLQPQTIDGRSLPPKEELNGDLTNCGGLPGATYGAGNDALPINCVPWTVAYAFCAWDRGRLPTEAEWNFAAAGGDLQRVYPWASSPAIDSGDAVYATSSPQPVGSKPAGKALWNQYDLAGNVAEWVRDGYVDPYPPGQCIDCAPTGGGTYSVRGGAFSDGPSALTTSSRGQEDPAHAKPNIGFRCARPPTQ